MTLPLVCLAGTLVCLVVNLSISMLLYWERRKLQRDLSRERKRKTYV